MVVRSSSIGGWCYFGIESTCTVTSEWNVSRVISELSKLAVEHGVVVVTAGFNWDNPRLYPMGKQFYIPVL